MENNNKLKILVTGSAGFIGGYLVEELLHAGHTVIGVDNYSKYGKISKTYDSHPNYHFTEGDAKDVELLKRLIAGCDQVITLAAKIGGISYFHTWAYDLLSENERLTAAVFDAAIHEYLTGKLKKINVISSSMVYENTDVFPTTEGQQRICPPPSSTYGFQKLSCEYFAQGAYEQYGLPYTIIRPFNCVGTGEMRAKDDKDIMSGNIKLAMSHVVPDLIQKIVKGQDPLHILGDGSQVRHYTYGGDLARGIKSCVETESSINEDFNLSTSKSTTVLELANLIWEKVNPGKEFRYVSEEPFPYDVKNRVPDVSKAERLLGFKAETNLEETLDAVIPWIRKQVDLDNI